MGKIILKKLFNNAGVLLSGRAAAGCLGIISISLAARALKPEALGIMAVIQSYAFIIDRLMNFQLWQAMIKFGADAIKRNDKAGFKSLAKFCLLLDVITAITGAIIAVAGVFIFSKCRNLSPQTLKAAMLFSLWILFNIKGTANGLLRVFDKFKLSAAATVSAAAVKTSLAILAYINSGSLFVFILIWLFANTIESLLLVVFGIYQMNKNIGAGFLTADLKPIVKNKTLWHFVISTNINQSVRLATKELDMVIIVAAIGTAAGGIYKIAKQFASVLAELIEPFYQAVYPQLAYLAAEKDYANLKKIVGRCSSIIGSAAIAIWLIAAVFSKQILNLAAGAEYIQAWPVLTVFMFGLVIWAFSFSLPAGLLALGRADRNMLVQIVCLFVFLPVLYISVKSYGLIGAAAAQIIFFLVYALLSLIFFVKQLSVCEGTKNV